MRAPGAAVAIDGRVVAAATLTISPRARGGARLVEIRARLAEFVAPWGVPTVAAIEGPSLKSEHREYDLGEGSGAIRSWVYERAQVEMAVVPPALLKRYATGNGQADKKAVIQYAVQSLGLVLGEDEDDTADAAVLAHIAYALAVPTRPATRHAAEVLRGLRLPPPPKPRGRRLLVTHNI